MDIAVEKVCAIIEHARALEVKEGATDPRSGSNPSDDGAIDTLTSDPDDLTEQELRDVLLGLNDDERDVGRTPDWLLGIPNLSDLLDEGLAARGLGC